MSMSFLSSTKTPQQKFKVRFGPKTSLCTQILYNLYLGGVDFIGQMIKVYLAFK